MNYDMTTFDWVYLSIIPLVIIYGIVLLKVFPTIDQELTLWKPKLRKDMNPNIPISPTPSTADFLQLTYTCPAAKKKPGLDVHLRRLLHCLCQRRSAQRVLVGTKSNDTTT